MRVLMGPTDTVSSVREGGNKPFDRWDVAAIEG